MGSSDAPHADEGGASCSSCASLSWMCVRVSPLAFSFPKRGLYERAIRSSLRAESAGKEAESLWSLVGLQASPAQPPSRFCSFSPQLALWPVCGKDFIIKEPCGAGENDTQWEGCGR